MCLCLYCTVRSRNRSIDRILAWPWNLGYGRRSRLL